MTGDTGTVRRALAFVCEAVELSRDGFSGQDLQTLDGFRKLHVEPLAAVPPQHSKVADL